MNLPHDRRIAGLAFLDEGGEMGAIMRAFDWSKTLLGPPALWPQPLRAMVRLILNSGHPMYIWWGEAGACLYNDAYRRSIGSDRHPDSLGQPAREVWAEIWDTIGPQIEQVMAGRGATWHENQLVPITRNGEREDVYWTYSYSPIHDDAAPTGVGGVLVVCSETTQHTRAERLLRSEIRRQRSLFMKAPSFIAILSGPNHVYEFVNDSYIRLIGERDYIGTPVRDAVPEVDGQGYFELLDNVYRTGTRHVARSTALRIRRKHDAPLEERFIDLIYEPITDTDGSVTGIFVEGSDVTERIAAETALNDLNVNLERRIAERTRELNRVWENSRDLLVIIDADGIYRSISPSWTDVLGYEPMEAVGRSFLDFVDPDDRQKARWYFERILAGEDIYTGDCRYRHKDGSTRSISWRASFEDNLIYGYGRDITQEREAAEKLAQMNVRLRTIFDTSHQFQCLISTDGVMLDANQRSLDTVAGDRDQMIGRPILESPWLVGNPEFRAYMEAAIQAALRGAISQQEVRVNLPVGGWRWLDVVVRPMRDPTGNVMAIVAEAADLTDRKMAEEGLRQSRKLEAMGQLTGGVAHDFNNLLTPIIGTLDMLHEDGVGGEREQRLVANALQSADRAKILVQRLLAFARRQPLQPIAVDLNQLVTGMSDLIGYICGPQVSVVVDVPATLPEARADPAQLEMALLNLSSNARDAMPAGGTLTLSARAETVAAGQRQDLRAGRYIRVSLTDDGEGMDAETLSMAIEPFFSTKGPGKGTGLGLSMVHGLVAQLGGGMEISSQKSAGTTVALWLPLDETDARPADSKPATPRKGRLSGRVLLVDDESEVRVSASEMLIDLGFQVTTATSATEALAIVAAGAKFDLVVTDHQMPEMTGRQLAFELRRRMPYQLILIVSGYSSELESQRDFPMLQKPFRRAELGRHIELLLKRRLPATPPHAPA